ncbi:hypothetical protein D3C72_1044470 [compost metagenome]
MAAPPQIKGGPTGISEKMKVATPKRATAGTPAIKKPTTATSACASAVPNKPYMTPRTVRLMVRPTPGALSPMMRPAPVIRARLSCSPSR